MTIARRYTIIEDQAVYHCVTRCVRRAHLCGNDKATGRNFDHRKNWILDRLKTLSQIFSIEVLSFAIMDNHCHYLLRTRPDQLAKLSDTEIARKWLMLHPGSRKKTKTTSLAERTQALLSEIQKVSLIRTRLVSISWFMKELNEFIARRANKEDQCKGRFWEGRFKCQRLVGEAAILSCSSYIDLNPIRAGIAPTPEESDFTSIQERIRLLQASQGHELRDQYWFSPIEMRKDGYGFLSISAQEYLNIVDASGRQKRDDKKGSISPTLAPILTRIGINLSNWNTTVNNCARSFGNIIGNKEELQKFAHQFGRRWLKGIRTARIAFS